MCVCTHVTQCNKKRGLFTQTVAYLRTFGDVWISMLKVHENIGNQRIKFAATISDSAEDLLSVGRSIEKERKKVLVLTRPKLCDLLIM